MRVAVLFPVWKRRHLAEISAAGLQRIAGEVAGAGITFTVAVVGSEDWAKAMAKRYGWDYVTASNSMLGAKFDKGARYLVDTYGDTCSHFMEWGADNIMSRKFTELLKTLPDRPGIHCITSNGFYMLKEGTDQVRLFSRGAGSNIGRVTLMAVVKKIRNTAGGQIFDHAAKRGLDKSFREKVQAVTGRRPKLHQIAAPYLIDVKGPGSLNGWPQFEAKPASFPLVEIEGDFPELQQIRETWQQPEKSAATPSTSTSTRSKGRTRSTTRSQTTRGKSSQAQQAAPSAASSKPSTRRRKTATGRGKS
jgi:hypothetical protein